MHVLKGLWYNQTTTCTMFSNTDQLLFLPPRTEPASLERNPVTPARGPVDCSGNSGTDALYALRNSSLTSFSLCALTD